MKELSKTERARLFYVVSLVVLVGVTCFIPGWTGVYL